MTTQEAARAAAIEAANHAYVDVLEEAWACNQHLTWVQLGIIGREKGIPSAITAYESAMAETNRALVERYENACINYGMNGDGGNACPQYDDMDAAQRALLISIGAAQDGDK